MNHRATGLREGMRRIRAQRDATRIERLRWYLLELIGWARCRWETRHHIR